jgi:hypothetical protein
MPPHPLLRLYITPCETGPGAWRHQAEILQAALSSADKLRAANSPAEADLIFITDLRDDQNYAKLRQHPLLQAYPEKCFVVTDTDEPPRWVRGVLTSLTRSPLNLGRFRSGSYALFHPDFRNAYIERWHAAGTPPAEKKFLFSFMGRQCNALRARLLGMTFERSDVHVEDTSRFNNFSHDLHDKDRPKRRYAEILLASKFVLCPRGNGAASIRLFEAMQLGIPPVIISDDWVFPKGPAWDECAVRIRESDLPRLELILSSREAEWAELGANARKAYDTYFHGPNYLRYLAQAALDIQRSSLVPERWIQRVTPAVVTLRKVRHGLRRRLEQRPAWQWISQRRHAHTAR